MNDEFTHKNEQNCYNAVAVENIAHTCYITEYFTVKLLKTQMQMFVAVVGYNFHFTLVQFEI